MKKKDASFVRKARISEKTVATSSLPVKPFPVVGFGASAGGLEAFSAVLENLKEDIGMAYVLVMHLSPTQKSSLAEILQLKTRMKVSTVKNGVEVKMNNIYVIPPNTAMSIVDGHLKLAPRDITSNGNFAIDYFLTALASVYKNNSIGVILSGTASDGTLGLKAIKAEGGITFAQDNSAKFPGMPKSAYESGYADFILSPKQIADELAELGKIQYTILPSDKVERDHSLKLLDEQEILHEILKLVKSRTGVDFFTHYKQASVYRRVARRVVLHKCVTLRDYHLLMLQNEEEIDELYNDFLINVTCFFRDEDFYETLRNDAFPNIIENRKLIDPIRIWVAGCATGEEAYSIAITLTEYLEKKDLNINFQIFASDLDANAIEKARLGIYPVSSLQNVSSTRLKRHFKKIDGHYQIEKAIREKCIFSQQNLIKDPPFSRIDLISCQNVLIYLENDPQQKILQSFHYALKPTGFLFLGKSETIGNANDIFDSLNKKVRYFSKKNGAIQAVPFFSKIKETTLPRHQTTFDSQHLPDLEKEIGKIILSTYVMPCVVANENLNIVQFFGVTSPYLSPVTGRASLNILKMIREDLLVDLRTLIQQAKKTGKPASKEGIIVFNKKTPQELSLEVVPKKMENELFFLVVFKENQKPSTHEKKIQKRLKTSRGQDEQMIFNLEEELARSKDLIRTTNEEYETTYEELQANNEQILSSNEELQSLNEELETSKEELQSANEELTTINEELNKRNIELKESQNYAKAIVDTVNSPFLVLTANLQVRIANKSFYDTFKLSPDLAEGSFIYELADYSWDIPLLREHLNALLAKKTNYLEFRFEHFFPKIGDLTFIINAYRLVREENKETLILLAFNNIGDLLKSNLDLKAVNDQLEQFIFVSSHDLQEPLRKIETFTNYLLDYDNSDEYIKKYLSKINASAAKLSALLKDLLSYSALLKNRSKTLVKVDLNNTIKNAVYSLDHLIKEHNGLVNIGQLPTIIADETQMELLFTNLISNALKFHRGNPVIDINNCAISSAQYQRFNLNKERNYICVTVSDNGIGFNQKYISKIFALFQRLHDKTGVEGTGMGLPICKKIVEDHEGRIYAEGKENEGATFSIYLPRT